MSTLRGKTNDSLHAAAAMLQLAHTPQPELTLTGTAQKRMFLGAALYYMVCGYRAFLGEILLGYQIERVPENAAMANQWLVTQGRHSGELEGLSGLEANAWLGDLLRKYGEFSAGKNDTESGVVQSGPSVNPSLAMDVSGDSAAQEQAAHWLRKLQSLVLEYSQLLDEW